MIRCNAAMLIVLLMSMLTLRVAAQDEIGFKQTGIASYYGHKFHGKKTSSGEVFNMWAMTAAHKSIPLNAKVRVTNLLNGKSVVVRINDHGPHARGRIIDLSRAAAERLGIVRDGSAKVELRIVNGPE